MPLRLCAKTGFLVGVVVGMNLAQRRGGEVVGNGRFGYPCHRQYSFTGVCLGASVCRCQFAAQKPRGSGLVRRLLRDQRVAMLQVAEIDQMSMEERLQAMELLWTSITRTPDAVRSPAWHDDLLAGRLAKIERGEGEFLTMDQLKERLQKPAK